MSDLSNERIKELACWIKFSSTQTDDPDKITLCNDIFTALVELNARRILAQERKQFWARRV